MTVISSDPRCTLRLTCRLPTKYLVLPFLLLPLCRYELRIVPPSSMKAEALREVRAGAVGQLVRIRAMVTRVSDVQPLVSVVTYTCDACG